MAANTEDEGAWATWNQMGTYLPLADTLAAADLVYPTHWQRALAPWFSSQGSEAVASTSTQSLPLAPHLAQTFTTRGLVIDGECLLEPRANGPADDDYLTPTPGAAQALRNWLQDHGRTTSGGIRSCRLIVLLHPTLLFVRRRGARGDEATNERLMAEDAPRLREAALSALNLLASELPSGTYLYYVWLAPTAAPSTRALPDESRAAPPAEALAWLACAPPGNSGSDGRLPSSTIAWAVRRHRLDLRDLVYVCASPGASGAHCLLARDSGLRQISAETFLGAHGRPPPPKKTTLSRFLMPFASTPQGIGSGSSRPLPPEPPLPLVLDGRPCASNGVPLAELRFGREHGLIECTAPGVGGCGTSTSAAGSSGRLGLLGSSHVGTPTAAMNPAAPAPSAPPARVQDGELFMCLSSSDDEDDAPLAPRPAPGDAPAPGALPYTPAPGACALPSLRFDQRDVLELIAGNENRMNAGRELCTKRYLALDKKAMQAEEAEEVLLRGSCRATAANSAPYALTIRLARPPLPLLIERACTCEHFTGTISKIAPGASHGERLCKHLVALMLQAIDGDGAGPTVAAPAAPAASSSGLPPTNASALPPLATAPFYPPAPPPPPPPPLRQQSSQRRLPTFMPGKATALKRKDAPASAQPPPDADLSAPAPAPAAASSAKQPRVAKAPSAASSAASSVAPGASSAVPSATETEREIVIPPRLQLTAEWIRRTADQTIRDAGMAPLARDKQQQKAPAGAARSAAEGLPRRGYGAPTAATGPPYPRPRGAAPKASNGVSKTWNQQLGVWEAGQAAPTPRATLQATLTEPRAPAPDETPQAPPPPIPTPTVPAAEAALVPAAAEPVRLPQTVVVRKSINEDLLDQWDEMFP